MGDRDPSSDDRTTDVPSETTPTTAVTSNYKMRGKFDADGVALAAIQGLSERLAEKDDRIDELKTENEALRERLAAVEDHLGLETGSDQAPPADN